MYGHISWRCRCRPWHPNCLWCFGALLTFLVLIRGRSANDDAVDSVGWSAESLPSPVVDPVGCKRPERLRDGSFLCNPDELLSARGARRADDQLDTISKLVTPCGDEAQGVEGGVAVISRMLPAAEEMGGPHKQVLYADAEDFAQQVQDGWRIGKRECDNGFLLLASKEDRQFAISVGYGLEPYLSGNDRKSVLNLMKPHLRRNDWDTAVSVALAEITSRLEKSLAQQVEADGSYLSREGLRGGFSQPTRSGSWWRKWDFGGAGGEEGGGDGDGEGGGGGGGDGFTRMMEKVSWPQDAGSLLVVPLIWGISEVITAVQRRKEQGFEKKLYRLETQGLIPAHGMDALQEAYLPVKLSDCPICLESFSHGLGMVGADGLPAAVLDCGHAFCQSCLARWQNNSSLNTSYRRGWRQFSTSPGMLCPVCDDAPPRPRDPRFGRRIGRSSRRPRLRRDGVVELFGSGRHRLPRGVDPSSESLPGRGNAFDMKLWRSVGDGRDEKHPSGIDISSGVPSALGGSESVLPPAPLSGGVGGAGLSSGTTSDPTAEAPLQTDVLRERASVVMGRSAAEMARRDRAFRLASLRVQYPKLMKRHADFVEGRPNATCCSSPGCRKSRQLNRWVSGGRPHDKVDDRKSFGGGSSSTATGGRW